MTPLYDILAVRYRADQPDGIQFGFRGPPKYIADSFLDMQRNVADQSSDDIREYLATHTPPLGRYKRGYEEVKQLVTLCAFAAMVQELIEREDIPDDDNNGVRCGDLVNEQIEALSEKCEPTH
jgi:hypothetical protein